MPYRVQKKYDDIRRNADPNSLGNSCLMRVSPLGIFGTRLQDKELLKYCQKDCSMTNPNPVAIDAVQVYVIAIKYALLGYTRNAIKEKIIEYCNDAVIMETIRRSIYNIPNYILTNSRELNNAYEQHSGYIGIALQIALTELFHGKSFYGSLINVMKKGGDADTNGCITGALLGAYYGIRSIPKAWICEIKVDNPRSKKYPEIDQKKFRKNCAGYDSRNLTE